MTEDQKRAYLLRCLQSGYEVEGANEALEIEMDRRAGLSETEHLREALRRAFRTAAFRLECGLPACPA